MEGSCAQHSAHVRAIGAHDRRLDSHSKQIDEHQEQLSALNETLAALKEIERQNQQRIDAMDERLAVLEARPAKRWEELVDKVVWLFVGAVLAYALGQLGL